MSRAIKTSENESRNNLLLLRLDVILSVSNVFMELNFIKFITDK